MNFFQKFVCCLILFAGTAFADSIELRDGRHLQGKYVGGTANLVGFMTAGAIQYFSTSDVIALIFDSRTEFPLGVQPESMREIPQSGEAPLRFRRSSGSKPARSKNHSSLPRQIAD